MWKVESWLRSLAVILQHSESYSKVESTQHEYSLSLVSVLYWDDFPHVVQHSEGVSGLVEAIPDVATCSTIVPYSATEVGEVFGCLKIFSVHFDWRGV